MLGPYHVAYFAASCDSVEDNTRFAEELDLNFPILSDPEKTTALRYGVMTEGRRNPSRWTFIIGIDGKILFIDRNVRSRSHGPDIAARLEALGIEKQEE